MIRFLLLVSLVWVSLPTPTWAQLSQAVQQFDEAVRLHNEGRYRTAIVEYERILELGYVTGPLYYNIGNAHFRVDEYGQALRHWEKARRLMGSTPELEHNIEIVRARIGTPFSSIPDPPWVTWWQRLVVPLGTGPYLGLGLILYLLAALLYGSRIWAQKQSATQRRLRLGALALGIMMLLVAIGVSASENRSSQGVVISRTAKLSEELGAQGTLDVPEGVVVKLVGQESTHYKVVLPDGREGYLPEGVVGAI